MAITIEKTIDFSKKVGPIKPMHAVGGGPKQGNTCAWDISNYFRSMNIPYGRLHDIEYPFGSGQFVDIHCIFPDFDADENDPASYYFTSTDMYLQAMVDVGCEPFYRLGESIDHTPKKRYVYPPKDTAKWARICEHIIRHYNEGWADGFHFGIKYWEIWNEPETGIPGHSETMWNGTAEQYYELYRVAANHLKNCFGDTIKVGGYASTNLNGLTDKVQSTRGQQLLQWANDFMAYINAPETWAPLDFFSYHKYTRDPYEIFDYHTEIRKWLDSKGREKAELILDEWNLGIFAETDQEKMAADDAARIAYVLLSSQKSPADMLMYYDIAKIRPTYNRLVSADKRPYSSYYSFAFFGALYALGTEVDSGAFERGCDVTLCAARNHKKGGISLPISPPRPSSWS